MAPIPTMVYICTTIKTDLKYLMSLHLYSVIIIPSDYSHMPQVLKFSDRYGLSTTMASFIYNGPWVLVKSVNHSPVNKSFSRHAKKSARKWFQLCNKCRIAFEKQAVRVLLWCFFQFVVKIVYISIFTLHRVRSNAAI